MPVYLFLFLSLYTGVRAESISAEDAHGCGQAAGPGLLGGLHPPAAQLRGSPVPRRRPRRAGEFIDKCSPGFWLPP